MTPDDLREMGLPKTARYTGHSWPESTVRNAFADEAVAELLTALEHAQGQDDHGNPRFHITFSDFAAEKQRADEWEEKLRLEQLAHCKTEQRADEAGLALSRYRNNEVGPWKRRALEAEAALATMKVCGNCGHDPDVNDECDECTLGQPEWIPRGTP